MKVLTIKQPWALLIAQGIKDIENRTWKTNFRGHIYIHAAAKNADNFTFTYEQSRVIDHLSDDTYFPQSAIIGEVDIIDCVQNHQSIWAEKGVWNWVLTNPILYGKPIENVKGKLSFWEFQIK